MYWLAIAVLLYDWCVGKHPPISACSAKDFLESLSQEEVAAKLAKHGLCSDTFSPIRFLRAVVLIWHLNSRRQPRTGYNVGSLSGVAPWSDDDA